MNTLKFVVLLSGAVFSSLYLVSCGTVNSSEKNIKAFYYPIEDLEATPQVYEYRALNNDTLGAQYWYFRTLVTDTATYLTSNIYNQFFEVEQFSIEELVSNGMLQKEYFLYDFDTTGTQLRFAADIEYDNAFPFQVEDSTMIYLQKMQWTFREEPLHTTTLIRNRRYMGETTYSYQGKVLEAIAFNVREVIDDFQDGHLEAETQKVEVYAKGIGLVYFKKMFSKDLVLEYELKDTYTMEALERKFGAQVEQ